MKILFCIVQNQPWLGESYQAIMDAAPDDITIVPFRIEIPGRRLQWRELDLAWKLRDRQLMMMYDRLIAASAECEVLLNYSGHNIHPRLLEQLQTFNVYAFFDDPESTLKRSAPMAAHFDAALYGNVSCQPLYEHFGCRRTAWQPIFNTTTDYPERHEGLRLAKAERSQDIIFCGGKNELRRQRLQKLSEAFPDAKCHGHGWQNGWIDAQGKQRLYQQSKVGWNVHNSTGPINQRMFTLAANGVLQICDNRTGLGKIFKLGEEAIGFDTIDQAIDATRFYLSHEEERQRVAEAACHRFWKDYHPTVLWRRFADQAERWMSEDSKSSTPPSEPTRISTSTHRRQSLWTAVQGKAIRRLAKWSEKVSDSSDALFKTFAERFSERFYVGEDMKPRSMRPRDARDGMTDPDSLPGRRRVLGWAATALIGSAQRIGVLGDHGHQFIELAGLQPGRELIDLQDETLNKPETLDLLIGLGPDISDLMSSREHADRLIWAMAADNHPDRLRSGIERLDEAFSRIRFFCLQHPFTPWLEPVDQPINGASMLITAEHPRQIAAE